MRRLIFTFLAIAALAVVALASGSPDRIYGRIVTDEGEVYQGLIRWGINEASWYDLLDGSKKVPERNREEAERAGVLEEKKNREIKFFGYTVAEWDEGGEFPTVAQSGIRFGHIRSIEPISRSQARLILKSGEEILLQGSVDIGSGIREIIVEDPEEGKQEIRWSEVDIIEFLDDGGETESKLGRRLYGTLLTRDGGGFKGYICWDLDELLSEDILDGDVEGKSRKVKFGEILSIERADSRSALVALKSGERFKMSGSNDVNKDNRDIIVSDPGMGQVRVRWEDFNKVVFEDVPAKTDFKFDGGHPLKGTVRTESGDVHRGLIRWDNDEEYSWEILDGEYRDLQFDVELGLIRLIDKKDDDSAIVTLLDGRTLELTGSNDVDDGNKGIFVTRGNGEVVVVQWSDFQQVEFDHTILAEQPEG